MTYRWATWLAPALQADPFIAKRLILVKGWETRGRPPELGFTFLPSGIVDHHTACMIKVGHDPQSCLNGILAGNGLAPPPVSQLLGTFTPPGVRWTGSNPDPRIMVVAAGRANHAGAGGYPWGAPQGNGSSIGIEWCGPPATGWPDIVIELRQRVDAAILRHNGWGVHQITTHHEYVQPVRPGAKIDPSGFYDAQPKLGQTQPWDAKAWRDGIYQLMNPPKPPATEDYSLRVTPPATVRPWSTDQTTATVDWPGGTVSWLQSICGVPQTGVWDAVSIAKMNEFRTIAGLPITGTSSGLYDQAMVNVFLAWRKR